MPNKRRAETSNALNQGRSTSLRIQLSQSASYAGAAGARRGRALNLKYMGAIMAAFLVSCNVCGAATRSDLPHGTPQLEELLGAGNFAEAFRAAKNHLADDSPKAQRSRSSFEYMTAQLSFWQGNTDDGEQLIRAAISDCRHEGQPTTVCAFYELRLIEVAAADIQRLSSIVGLDIAQQQFDAKQPNALKRDKAELETAVSKVESRIAVAESAAKPGIVGTLGIHSYANALRIWIALILGQTGKGQHLAPSAPTRTDHHDSIDAYGVLQLLLARASLARQLNQQRLSVSLLQTSIEYSTTHFGPRHPLTLSTLEHLGIELARFGSTENARDINKDWLARINGVTDARYVHLALTSASLDHWAEHDEFTQPILESLLGRIIRDDGANATGASAEIKSIADSFGLDTGDFDTALINTYEANVSSLTVGNRPAASIISNFVAVAYDNKGLHQQAQAIRRAASIVNPTEVPSDSAKAVLAKNANTLPSTENINELVAAAGKLARSDRDLFSALQIYKLAYERARMISPITSILVVQRLIDVARTLVSLDRQEEALALCDLYTTHALTPSRATAAVQSGALQSLVSFYNEIGDLRRAEETSARLHRDDSTTELRGESQVMHATAQLPSDSAVATILFSQGSQALRQLDRSPLEQITTGIAQLEGTDLPGAIATLSAGLLRLESVANDVPVQAARAEANRGLAIAYHRTNRFELSAYFYIRFLNDFPVTEGYDAGKVAAAVTTLSEITWSLPPSEAVSEAFINLVSRLDASKEMSMSTHCDVLLAIAGMRHPSDTAISTVMHGALASEAESRSQLASLHDQAKYGLCAFRLFHAMGEANAAKRALSQISKVTEKSQVPLLPMGSAGLPSVSSIAARSALQQRCMNSVGVARKTSAHTRQHLILSDLASARCLEAGDYQNAVAMDIEVALLGGAVLADVDSAIPLSFKLSTLDERAKKYQICAKDRSSVNPLAPGPAECAIAYRSIRRAAVMLALADTTVPPPQLYSTTDSALRPEGEIRKVVGSLLESDAILCDFAVPNRADILWDSLTIADATRDDEATRAIEAVADRQHPPERSASVFSHQLEITGGQLQQVRDRLKAEVEVLVYYRAQGRYFCWFLSDTTISFYELAVEPLELREDIARLLSALDPTVATFDTSDNPFPLGAAWRVYQEVVGDVISPSALKKTTYVVPDDQLRNVPFSALITQPSAIDGWTSSLTWVPSWVAFSTAIVIEPNLRALIALSTFENYTARPTMTFAGFGSPTAPPGSQSSATPIAAGAAFVTLPGAAGELRSLSELFGTPDENLWLEAKMTKDQIMGVSLTGYNIIAFATHGRPRDQLDPTSDAALLVSVTAENSPADRWLTARDVSSLRLDADEVVLSACRTAPAAFPLDDDNLQGLPAAFLFAGSRSVLVTLWPVLDELSPVITYDALGQMAKHVGAAEALRWAQVQSASGFRDKRMRPPGIWAAFTLIGSSEALQNVRVQ